ncbi:hypothetical protein E4H12_15125 [Candidatus Thorarchaeota archaeon]|jgi:hypothetical protein|nr:MAG: hypothetical protein E4H12_15125 [Candidatus Thorarchaeota archaeon]
MGTESEYPAMLRYTFVLHFIVAFVFGFMLFLIPDTFNTLIGHTTPADPVNIGFGVMMIGIGVGSVLAFRATKWETVILFVQMELVYCPLALIGGLYTIMLGNYPAWFMWVYVGIMALFFVLFLIPYYKHMKS